MSLDPLWAESLQKAATKYFYSLDVGLPWDLDNLDNEQTPQKKEGPKVSLSFLDPTITRLSEEEYIATFKIRLVCTIPTDGLYDLSSASGGVASCLLVDISNFDICAAPIFEKVKIHYFDISHGYKQSLMEQEYTSRLRG